ncbi:MAG: hypothetical protein WCP70_07180 [Methanothrix sp.]
MAAEITIALMIATLMIATLIIATIRCRFETTWFINGGAYCNQHSQRQD